MRKTELSYLNILFCMLVIFIHLISYPLSGYTTGTIPYSISVILWRLTTFVVQGFVLFSGLKMFLGKEKPYFRMLLRKLKVIILPYVFWYVVYYMFYMAIWDYPLDISFILKHFIAGSLAPHTYFVPLIMQFFILYPLWKLMVKKIKPYIAIPVAVIISLFAENVLPVILYNKGINFLYNDRMFTTYLSYWVVGCYMGANYEKTKSIISKGRFYIPFVIFTVLNIFITYLHYNNLKLFSFMNEIHTFYCFSAILFLFALFLKVPDIIYNKIKLLKITDNASYTIYLCHMLYVFLANYLFANLFAIQSNILLFVLMALFVYPLSVITSHIIKRLHAR